MPTPYRTVFFGTPEFAVPILESLAEQTDVRLVVTQPDRPSGRGRVESEPPVKTVAKKLGLEVVQPKVVKGRRFAERIAALEPDFLVTAAFGRILGPSALLVPKKASVNVHASLLPRHRGAAPANWAVLSGDEKTGVSIMRMVKELDAGPVFNVEKTAIGDEETAGELLTRLATIGARVLVETLESFDSLEPRPQKEEDVTWAPMLRKSDGVIDWKKSAAKLHRHIRGMHPWPCATTLLEGNPLKVHAATVSSFSGSEAEPGTVLEISDAGLKVACGEGAMLLTELQAAGRKRLLAKDFIRGMRVTGGVLLGK